MKATVPIMLAAVLLLGLPAFGGPKVKAPCKVYFSVFESDDVTQGSSLEWLDRAQKSWYEKHGDRGKIAGICYAPKEADVPPDASLYRIQWGNGHISTPFNYSYTTQEQQTQTVTGTVTDSQGTHQVNEQVTTTRPVQHDVTYDSDTQIARGWLFVRDPAANNGKGDLESVGGLKNHNHTFLTWPSSSLLKSAVDEIQKREKERLAQ
ncbi:MAG TPA: hypothetical protein VMI32_20100 [Candidatus Solibacter sp.]|nr:hypothetical protein [Candidatus Solibacter sp.]